MKGRKKVFAKLLSCVLVLSMVFGSTTTAFAAKENQKFTVTYKDASDDKIVYGSETVVMNQNDYWFQGWHEKDWYGLTKGIKEPTKEGYDFLGWSTNKNDSKNAIKSSVGLEITNNTTYYAHFSKQKTQQFTVKFYNGNSQVGKDQKVDKDGFAVAPTIESTAIDNKSDKLAIETCVGWTVQGDTSGKIYTNEEINKNL